MATDTGNGFVIQQLDLLPLLFLLYLCKLVHEIVYPFEDIVFMSRRCISDMRFRCS